MGGKVGENPAALRAAVFSLSSKNPRGGGRSNAPPPSRAHWVGAAMSPVDGATSPTFENVALCLGRCKEKFPLKASYATRSFYT